MKKYEEALGYIQNFIDYSKTHPENIAPENFELARMVRFLAALGNPQQAYAAIHVAGTKGKGSVSALCAGALRAGGYQVGLYTSPHLQSFTERIQINGVPVTEAEFVHLVEGIKPIVDTIAGLTAYELQTALAFVHFAKQGVDIAVIEVGLGGRLDSTNVIAPLVSVITSISLDHTFVLGETLAEIAGEKGGIIKRGVPVVSAPQVAVVQKRLMDIAVSQDARFVIVGRDVTARTIENTIAGQRLAVENKGGSGEGAEIGIKLLGEHQAENATLAYAALEMLNAQGFELPLAAIQQGFVETTWPGRFEIVNEAPMVVLDGAHNRDSAKRLVDALQFYFPDSIFILLFGASSDKDVTGMFAELLPAMHTFVATTSSHPRAMSVQALLDMADDYDCEQASEQDVSMALSRAFEIAEREAGVLIATGSLYALGEVREAWFLRTGA